MWLNSQNTFSLEFRVIPFNWNKLNCCQLDSIWLTNSIKLSIKKYLFYVYHPKCCGFQFLSCNIGLVK